MITGAKKAKFSVTQLLLTILLVAAMAFVAFNVMQIVDSAERDRENRDRVSQLDILSTQLTSHVDDATSGSDKAFDDLKLTVDSMDQSWKRLKASLRNDDNLDSSKLSLMDNSWGLVQEKANTILADRETILYLNQVASTLNNTLPELQQAHLDVVDILIEGRSPGDQIAQAVEQAWRVERIGRNIDKMLAGGSDAEAAADQFNLDANKFGKVLEGMRNGDAVMGISRVVNRRARENLDLISERFQFVSNEVQAIFEATPALFRARQASEVIDDESLTLDNEITALEGIINELPKQRQFTDQTALLGGGAALLILFLMGVISWTATRRSAKDSNEANERNQGALIRLLDEIGGLAEGDLTSEATVTEDFTGAIADSINYAIDQLRILVSRIQDTAENVAASANETRATALELSDASEHQAQEIIGASAAINEMAVTIDQVSTNAAESAVVAERSVSIAKKGGEVVRDTITGMDTIREQIQDTSKRIKRLGESSQEIGDIVSLINEIADQTNILALNAAIQASMAGEAGRGFAVVADEVQGLAERSASATKQIASLVKTIQTDTNEAVSSMESTTTEVVKGAELAHNAGVALEEIEKVSADLAELIQDISTAARQQAKTASHVSGTMNVIREISSQTLSGTTATAQSVGELAEMAVDMRESVSGFKLPEVAGHEDAVEEHEEFAEQDHGTAGFDPYGQLPVRESDEEEHGRNADELVMMAEDIADTLSTDSYESGRNSSDDIDLDISEDQLLVADFDREEDELSVEISDEERVS
ncbi:methyl-accepting chemotaxis protein [Porticoccaceae bacterium LTM1]|nr:methyl-accepting chemotaxis protein [Porticoccaceae bacterium LTM1]